MQWSDFYNLQENDERGDGNGRNARDKKNMDRTRKVKQKASSTEDNVQRNLWKPIARVCGR